MTILTDTQHIGGISSLDSAATRRALDAMFPVDHAAIVVQEMVDARTRAARAEIHKLMAASGGLDVLEALSILSTLVSAFEHGRVLSCSKRAIAAAELLSDAVHVLEAE